MDGELQLFTDPVATVERELLGIKDGYENATRVLVDWMRETGHTFGVEGIRAWDEFLQQPHRGRWLSASSRNMYRKCLRHRVRWILDQTERVPLGARLQVLHALDEIRFDEVQPDARGEDSWFTEDEVARVLDCARTRNRHMGLLAEFIVTQGTRIGETLDILNADVKIRGDMAAILLHGKGSKRYRVKDRTVHCTVELLRRIRKEFHGCDYLFGLDETDRRFTRNHVSMFLIRASGETVGKALGSHALRHTFATLALHDHPEELKAISEYLGHADISTTNVYLHGGWDGSKARRMLRDWGPRGSPDPTPESGLWATVGAHVGTAEVVTA
jgi:integrase